MDNIISSILSKVVANLVIFIFNFIWKKIFTWFHTKSETLWSRRKNGILKVSEDQIKEFNIGHINNPEERQDAIDYLKNDLRRQINTVNSENQTWLEKNNSTILSYRNFIILFISLIVIQVIYFLLGLPKVYLVIYLIFGLIILLEISVFISWLFHGKKINKKFRLIIEEVNRALFILGPSLRINIFDLISAVYEKDQINDPTKIQKQLSSFGFLVKRSEIMRVTLSYLLREKTLNEKREIVSNILGSATGNLDKYKSIPDDKRMDIEMLFLNDYIDDPFAEVQIISLK